MRTPEKDAIHALELIRAYCAGYLQEGSKNTAIIRIDELAKKGIAKAKGGES